MSDDRTAEEALERYYLAKQREMERGLAAFAAATRPEGEPRAWVAGTSEPVEQTIGSIMGAWKPTGAHPLKVNGEVIGYVDNIDPQRGTFDCHITAEATARLMAGPHEASWGNPFADTQEAGQ